MKNFPKHLASVVGDDWFFQTEEELLGRPDVPTFLRWVFDKALLLAQQRSKGSGVKEIPGTIFDQVSETATAGVPELPFLKPGVGCHKRKCSTASDPKVMPKHCCDHVPPATPPLSDTDWERVATNIIDTIYREVRCFVEEDDAARSLASQIHSKVGALLVGLKDKSVGLKDEKVGVKKEAKLEPKEEKKVVVKKEEDEN